MRWVWLTILALVALVAAAFTIQNSSFTAPLQLDLGVAAWRLRHPAGVPVLMWSSFGAGIVLSALVFGVRSAQLGRRVRQLEQEAALGTSRARDPWAGG